MKLTKMFLMIFLLGLWSTPALTQEMVAKKTVAAEKKPSEETHGLVIGKNLKVGMPLEKVIKLLGIPKSMAISRGTEPVLDSFQIDYPEHGLVIYALNNKQIVEEIEVLPSFEGRFSEGLKMGSKFPQLVSMYGMPKKLTTHLARYPDRGMFFVLKDDAVISAKLFVKNSKILDHQLIRK